MLLHNYDWNTMIIILNGCPSAGKTSIIKEIQSRSPTPLLNMGIDRFWATIPAQYKEYGSKAHEGYSFSKSYDNDANPIIYVKKGPFAHQLEKTMPHVINTFAECGHDVIVDEIFNEEILHNYAKALQNQTVYFIGIECSLAELERREKLRGNRELGLARGHFNFVHINERYYDFTIDTTNLDAATCAQEIISFIQRTPQPLGFKRLCKHLTH